MKTFPLPEILESPFRSLQSLFFSMTASHITEVGYLCINNSLYCRNVGFDKYRIRQLPDGEWIFANGDDYHQDEVAMRSKNRSVLDCFRIITESALDEYANRHISSSEQIYLAAQSKENDLIDNDKKEYDQIREYILNPICEAIQCINAFSINATEYGQWAVKVLGSTVEGLGNIESRTVGECVLNTIFWYQTMLHTPLGRHDRG